MVGRAGRPEGHHVNAAWWLDDAAVKAGGTLMALMAITALATYIPVAKWVDRSDSPRPFIGLTFLLFAIFPISLVVLPRISAATGIPVMAGLVLAYVLNLGNVLEIDLSDALEQKVVKNALKYPVEKYRGRFEANEND